MKQILIAAVVAVALAAPSYAAMMDYEQAKMKVEESLKMHPLPEADAMKANEAIMKADEMYKAGKKEEASKALEETIMMYKIDVK
jgi:opacity protein-like surface antigen